MAFGSAAWPPCEAQTVQGVIVRDKTRTPIGLALFYSPSFTLDTNKVVEHAFAVPDFPPAIREAYLPADVTRQAAYKVESGTRGPRYPDRMRASGRGGVVRAQFVVDRNGRADMSTFQVLESDDFLFTRSVRKTAAHLELVPAELNGMRVLQLFEMDVEFRLGDAPFRLHAPNAITVTATPGS